MRPVRQVLLLARHASENASRTIGACFAHRVTSRAIGGRFRYRVLRGKLLPLRNFEYTKKEADLLVDLLLYYTVMSHVFGMLRKR